MHVLKLWKGGFEGESIQSNSNNLFHYCVSFQAVAFSLSQSVSMFSLLVLLYEVLNENVNIEAMFHCEYCVST